MRDTGHDSEGCWNGLEKQWVTAKRLTTLPMPLSAFLAFNARLKRDFLLAVFSQALYSGNISGLDPKLRTVKFEPTAASEAFQC